MTPRMGDKRNNVSSQKLVPAVTGWRLLACWGGWCVRSLLHRFGVLLSLRTLAVSASGLWRFSHLWSESAR